MQRSYGWVIVAVGALMTCVGIGAMFSLAVYLQPMSVATGWSRAGISSAMTFDFLTMGVAGFAWGAVSDRFGTRIVVLCGAVLLGLALTLASRASSLVEFQLVYGILVGVASGAFFAPMIAAASTWFEQNRSLAVSLVSAGMGVAPMTISPFARFLISTYDWRTAMLTIGIAAWILLIPAALLVRQPPAAAGAGAARAPSGNGAGLTAAQALRSPQLAVLALTFFACCAAHSGPIFHMVSYAIGCGIPAMAAVSIYSVEGASGLAGRLLFGIAADRFGVKLVLVVGLLLSCGQPARRVLHARRRVRHRLRRRDAALRGARARVFRAAHHGHRVRRRHHGVGYRHGDWPARRRLRVRHVRELRLALHRLVRGRARRGLNRADVPAIAVARAGGIGGGVGGLRVAVTAGWRFRPPFPSPAIIARAPINRQPKVALPAASAFCYRAAGLVEQLHETAGHLCRQIARRLSRTNSAAPHCARCSSRATLPSSGRHARREKSGIQSSAT
jgi:MFS family permease